MSIESVMPSSHLILCHPLLFMPSIFPRIRVFSNACSSAQMTKWQICTHTQYSFFPLKRLIPHFLCVQFSYSCLTLCDPMDHSTSGFSVHHQLLELAQTHVRKVDDAIQASHPLWSPSPPALNLSQHQVFFQWVSSSHQVAKVLEFQLQHQYFQWIFRTDSFRMD